MTEQQEHSNSFHPIKQPAAELMGMDLSLNDTSHSGPIPAIDRDEGTGFGARQVDNHERAIELPSDKQFTTSADSVSRDLQEASRSPSYSNAQLDSVNGVLSESRPNQSPISNEVQRCLEGNQGEELNIQGITNYRVSTISAFNIHAGFFFRESLRIFLSADIVSLSTTFFFIIILQVH